MEKFVTSANIKHYRELLTIESDEHRRQQLCRFIPHQNISLITPSLPVGLRGGSAIYLNVDRASGFDQQTQN
jgi:hypothetical protein